MMECSSCKRKVEKYVKYKCPSCNELIIRCDHCRSLTVVFECNNCGQELP